MAVASFSSRLPDEPTRLIGARAEIAEVTRLLGEHRFVTITGPAGVGKTRLALRVGHELLRAYQGNVWFVELANLLEPTAIPLQVELAVSFVPSQIPGSREAVLNTLQGPETSRDLLRGREGLLILDNCEHLIEGVARFVEALLTQGRELRVLATSREPVGIYGEFVHVLQPLPTTKGRQEASGGGISDAAELFISRAEATGHLSRATLHRADLAAIDELCTRLDGIPLAIELAAAQVPTMHPREILDRLDDMAESLWVGTLGPARRHRSIDAALGWSFQMCTPAEQLLWLRTSVFRGGFDRSSAAEVCVGDGLEAEDVAPAIRGLVAKSVLSPTYVDGAARYRMLEPIRAFASARLRKAQMQATYIDRHRRWATSLVADCEANYVGPAEFEMLARLEVEHQNIAAAVERLLQRGADPALIYPLVVPLAVQRWAHGFQRESPRWLELATQLPQAPSPARGVALAKLAILGRAASGDVSGIAALVEQARAEIGTAQDHCAQACLAAATATLQRERGETAAALATVQRALDLHTGEPDEATGMLLTIGTGIASRSGTFDETAAWYARMRATLDPTGVTGFQGAGFELLCSSAVRAGRFDQVREMATEILHLPRDVLVPMNVAVVVSALALAAIEEGDFERGLGLTVASHRLLAEARALKWEASSYGVHSVCVQRCTEAIGEAKFARAVASAPDLTHTELIAMALGVPSPAPDATLSRGVAVSPSSLLSRREREVAALVAEGLTDREIADRLVVSIRTAQGHVGQCLGKLHLTSRTQLALWVREQEASGG